MSLDAWLISSRARTCALVLLSTLTLLAGAGCASHAKPAVTAAAVPSAPPPAPVPSDPLALVPADATFVALVDVRGIAASPLFQAWRSWGEKYACTKSEDIDWIATSTERVLVANRKQGDEQHWLTLLVGKYAAGDVDRALGLLDKQLIAASGATAAPPHTTRKQGRFDVTTSGPYSASLLDDKFLVVGNDASVSLALDAVEHPPAQHFADSELFTSLGGRVDCQHRSVCALITPESLAAHGIKRGISQLGNSALATSLSRAQSAIGLDINSGFALVVVSQLGSPDEAQSSVKMINDWIWQIGVFARLAGFPDVFDSAKVSGEGALLRFEWGLNAQDLELLKTRLADMLEHGGAAPSCPGDAPKPAT